MKLRALFLAHVPVVRSLALVGFSGLTLISLGGCSGEEAPRDNTAMLPADERVSSVPWNKPQGWENQGALGSLANDPRIGGQVQP